jgi:hypothetical protein
LHASKGKSLVHPDKNMNKTVHAVYWIENNQPHVELFTDLPEMLKFSLSKHNNPECSFVASGSQMPDCVSLGGVDVTGPDYDWKKRRK